MHQPSSSQPSDGRLHLGERTFTVEGQRAFATMSSDVNPLHMDPVLARRLLTGRQVVHGVNVLLHAIELWLNHYNQCPTGISCSFTHAVCVGDHASFSETSRTEHDHTIEVSVNGVVCLRIVLRTAISDFPDRPARAPARATAGVEDYVLLTPTSPLEIPPAAQRDRKYEIPLSPKHGKELFPLIGAMLPSRYAAALAALSYFVGMVCPGVHSILSSINVQLDAASNDADSLFFTVDKFDDRFSLFVVSVRGFFAGEVRAFLRPPPARQYAIADLSCHIERSEFFGTTSLVIGGSRGLGELTAKILASGGGRTIITYANGAGDAQAVSDEINASGLASCEAVAFDVLTDTIGSFPVDLDRVQMIYFFATPRIYRKKSSVFDRALFEEFFRFYVTQFYEMCVYLESVLAKPVRIYFPSSVYVESRPRDFAEYAMAKSAAEVLIADMNRVFKKVSIVSSRLPRLSTDQTSTVLTVAAESNIDVIAPIVRLMAAPAAQ